jgi:hypothetical protein
MNFSVGLHRDSTRKGGIPVSTLPAAQASDHIAQPEGVLSRDEAELDLFIFGDRPRPAQDSEHMPLDGMVSEPEAQLPLDDLSPSKHPHGTKRSRQAMGVVARLSMEHHGWKQTGTKSSLWTFEHRWPHMRDRAEGRNHRLQTN